MPHYTQCEKGKDVKYQVLMAPAENGVPKGNTFQVIAGARSALAHALGAACDAMIAMGESELAFIPIDGGWEIKGASHHVTVRPVTRRIFASAPLERPPTCPSRIRGAPPISGWRSPRAAHYIAECPAPPVRHAITFRFMREDGSLIPKSDKQAPLPQRQGEIRAMLPTLYQPSYAPPDAALVFAFLQGKLLGFRYLPDPR